LRKGRFGTGRHGQERGVGGAGGLGKQRNARGRASRRGKKAKLLCLISGPENANRKRGAQLYDPKELTYREVRIRKPG